MFWHLIAAYHRRIENLKDMVLFRFGSTGVVQVLSKAAEILGLVPVFPVRNINTFSSGSAGSNAVFRDCVLVKKYEVHWLVPPSLTDAGIETLALQKWHGK